MLHPCRQFLQPDRKHLQMVEVDVRIHEWSLPPGFILHSILFFYFNLRLPLSILKDVLFIGKLRLVLVLKISTIVAKVLKC